MTNFAGYQVVSELHRSGVGTVYSASRGGSGAASYIVKTCQPQAFIIGEEAASAAIARFVEQAATQRRIGESERCGKRWAKVLEIGRLQDDTGSGAFLVSELATRGTAEKLFTGRVRLDSRTLAWVVGEVVEGLRDLQAAFKRGHGALKGSNVLLIGTADQDLATCRVALCDVLADDRADAGRDALADQKAIGEIIHQLVLHSKFRGGWPVESGPAWSAMGRNGSKWREIVNQLLDPSDKATRPSLDELAERIAALAVEKKSRTPMYVGLAAAVLLLGGGTTAYLMTRETEKIVITRWSEQTLKNWNELCSAYRSWYSLFQAGLNRPPTQGLAERGYRTRREAYAAIDPQLKELLALPGVADGFDPWSIARLPNRDLPPTSIDPMKFIHVRTDDGVEKTEKALAAIDALKKGLIEGWEAPKRLVKVAGEYRAAGWTNAAAFIESAAADSNPEQSSDPALAVDKVLSVVPVVEKIDASIAQAKADAATLGTIKDPVLDRFAGSIGAMVTAEVGQGGSSLSGSREDLLKLETVATSVAKLAADLKIFIEKEWPRVEVEDFVASAKYKELTAGASTVQAFSDWMSAAKQHPSLKPEDDPRNGIAFTDLLGGLDKQRTTLTSAPLKGEIEPSLAQRLDKIKTDVGAILPDTLIWKRKNEQKVRGETTRVKKELEDLRVSLDGLIERKRIELAATAAEVRNRLAQRNEIAAGSVAINTAWKTWRDALLSGFKDETYAETQIQAKQIEDALVNVNGSVFPQAMERAGEGVPQAEWAGQLADVASAEREKRIAAVLGKMGSGVPDVRADAFTGAVAAAGRDFGAWQEKVRALRSELAAAENALNAGTDADGKGLDAAVSKWSADPVGQQTEIAAAIGGLKARVLATKAVAAEKNLDVLLGNVLNPDPAKPELARAAWKRMGDADIGWPKSIEQARRVTEIKPALARTLGTLPQAQRAQAAAQVAGDLSSRWSRMALTITDPRQMESAIGLMREFSVDEATLDPRLKYNIEVGRLKQSVADATMTDAQASQVAREFISKVRGLGSVASARGASGLLSRMDEIANSREPEKPKINPVTLGPGSAGGRFTGTFNASNGDLKFTGNGVSLDFIRVQLAGEDAVYISARELSIGEMIAIVTGGNGMGQFTVNTPVYGIAGIWTGPRGWTWQGQQLTVGPWIRPDSNMTAQLAAYAPGILKAGTIASIADNAGGEPTPQHPAQNISPITLGVVARLAGCRFPTAAEWKATYQQLSGGAIPSGANLRDQTFERQKQHVQQARGQVLRQDAFQWPDDGAFLLSSAPKAAAARSRASNDGILWFTRADQGSTGERAMHIVGNVAEFVVESGTAFEALPTNAPATAVEGVFDTAQLGIIGGSALSDPDMPVDQMQKVSMFDAADGFADVGVRLAFNAAGTAPPRESFVSRLNKMITDEAYLLSGN